MTITIYKQKNGFSLSAEEKIGYNTVFTSGVYVTEDYETLLEKISDAMKEVEEKKRMEQESKPKA